MADTPRLSSSAAQEIAREACAVIAHRGNGATLVRLGENAIVRVEDPPLIVRIARGVDVFADAAKEVRVARWLDEIGLRAARTLEIDQPIVIQGHPVTFWHVVPDSGAKASTAELAQALQQIHTAPVPDWLELPELDLFGRVGERITRSRDITDDDREFLTTRLGELRAAADALVYPGPPVAVHGDAHVQNLICDPDAGAVLIDFERFALGARETDLAVTATETAVGWHTEADYQAFCDTYGADVREWSGFATIREINKLKMTTWLMQNIAEDEQTAAEYRTRLATLIDPDSGQTWQPY